MTYKHYLEESPLQRDPFDPYAVGYPFQAGVPSAFGRLTGCQLVYGKSANSFKGFRLSTGGKHFLQKRGFHFRKGLLLVPDYPTLERLLSCGIRLLTVPKQTGDISTIFRTLFPHQANFYLARMGGCRCGWVAWHEGTWAWRGVYLEYRPCKCRRESCLRRGQETGSIEDITEAFEKQTDSLIRVTRDVPTPNEIEEVITNLDSQIKLHLDVEVKHYSTPGEVAGKLELIYSREGLANYTHTNGVDPLLVELHPKLDNLERAGIIQARRLGRIQGFYSDRKNAYFSDLAACYSMSPDRIRVEKTTTSTGSSKDQLLDRLYSCLEVYCTEALVVPGFGQSSLFRHIEGTKTGLYTPPVPRLMKGVNKDQWIYEVQKGGSVEPLEAYWIYPKNGKIPIRPFASLINLLVPLFPLIPWLKLVGRAVTGKLRSSYLVKSGPALSHDPHTYFRPVSQLPDGGPLVVTEKLPPQFNLLTRVTMMCKSETRMRQRIDLDQDSHIRAGIDSSQSIARVGPYSNKSGDFRPPKEGLILVVNDIATSFPGDGHRQDYEELSLNASPKAKELEADPITFRLGLEVFSGLKLMPYQAQELLGELVTSTQKIKLGSIKTLGETPTNEELRKGISGPRRLPRTLDDLHELLSRKEEDDADE